MDWILDFLNPDSGSFQPEMSMDLDWIRTEVNFGRIGTGSDCSFFKFGVSGLDRTDKFFVILM